MHTIFVLWLTFSFLGCVTTPFLCPCEYGKVDCRRIAVFYCMIYFRKRRACGSNIVNYKNVFAFKGILIGNGKATLKIYKTLFSAKGFLLGCLFDFGDCAYCRYTCKLGYLTAYLFCMAVAFFTLSLWYIGTGRRTSGNVS